MSESLYPNRGNQWNHDEDQKPPPLSVKDCQASLLGGRPGGLMTVPGLSLWKVGRGRLHSEWFFFLLTFQQTNKKKI